MRTFGNVIGFLGLAAMVLAIWALIKGSLSWARIASSPGAMKQTPPTRAPALPRSRHAQ